jgi:hypothetical protein
MKTSSVLKAAAFVALGGVCFSSAAFADSRNSKNRLIYPDGKTRDKYVFVTGSYIPQRIQIKSIGTATVSPIRVYGRTEIDLSGRFTTEKVLALDPSVQIRSGGLPGN